MRRMVSVVQNGGLVFLGIVLALGLVEGGMRLGGYALTGMQEEKNQKSIRHGSTYTILCLGESTTAGFGENAYPFILQQILNSKSNGLKFKVINKGVMGTKCVSILSGLESNLDLYKPDMVMVMMGINDSGTHMPREITAFSDYPLLRRLKIYKLAQYIALHVTTKINKLKNGQRRSQPHDTVRKLVKTGKGISNPAQIKNDESWKTLPVQSGEDEKFVALGWQCKSRGEFKNAEAAFEKAVALNPYNDQAYVELGFLYGDSPDFRRAIDMFKKAAEIQPDNAAAYRGLGWAYVGIWEDPNYSDYLRKAQQMFSKAIECEPREILAYMGLARVYRTERDFSKAHEILLQALEVDPQNEIVYRELVGLCAEFDRKDLAEYYLRKGNASLPNTNDLRVGEYYRNMYGIVAGRGIRFACVQYPTLNVEPLMAYFGNDAKGIIFIENREIFLQALKGRKYSDLFSDMFAGTFGHCTVEGNKLLASNIADTIYKKVFDKK